MLWLWVLLGAVAAISLLWPWWAGILRRQELADPHVEGGLH